MKFARVGAEVFLRRKELKTKDQKQYQFEALLLYELILFHTFWDTGLCRKTINEICEIWDLDYDNSMRRFKLLRQKGWVKKEGKYIRPLVGLRTVKSTETEDEQTVDFTAESEEETVNPTVFDCNDYSKPVSKTVKSTVSPIPFKEPLKIEPDQDTQHRKSVSVGQENFSETNGHKSQFSLDECLKYVEACQTSGDQITNPRGLAMTLYKTGEADVFILRTLYPQQGTKDMLLTREQIKEVLRFCPGCHGSEMEIVPGKGARTCRHDKLPDALNEAIDEGDIAPELVSLYEEYASSKSR